MNDKDQELYRDWFNNFLTVEGFADNYDMSLEEAYELLQRGREYHSNPDNFINKQEV